MQRVAGPVGHTANSQERDAVCIGDRLRGCRLLVNRVEAGFTVDTMFRLLIRAFFSQGPAAWKKLPV